MEFIICEDNEDVQKIDRKIISQITMPYNFNYSVRTYSKYCSELKTLINNNIKEKIYILDIEFPGKSGIDISREIRDKDWDSKIVIQTVHNELEMNVLKSKLLIFDFISKYDNFESDLKSTLKKLIEINNNKKSIKIKSDYQTNYIDIEKIVCISRTKEEMKTKIITVDESVLTNESLISIEKKLDSRFVRVHRSYILNKNYIVKIDKKKNEIELKNGKIISYISRKGKKEIKKNASN